MFHPTKEEETRKHINAIEVFLDDLDTIDDNDDMVEVIAKLADVNVFLNPTSLKQHTLSCCYPCSES